MGWCLSLHSVVIPPNIFYVFYILLLSFICFIKYYFNHKDNGWYSKTNKIDYQSWKTVFKNTWKILNKYLGQLLLWQIQLVLLPIAILQILLLLLSNLPKFKNIWNKFYCKKLFTLQIVSSRLLKTNLKFTELYYCQAPRFWFNVNLNIPFHILKRKDMEWHYTQTDHNHPTPFPPPDNY